MANLIQKTQSKVYDNKNIALKPTQRYTIAMREPWSLPESPVELPSPGQSPGQPPTINLLSTLLPPILMAIGIGVTVATNNSKPVTIIPMLLMAIGFPVANLIGLMSQKKKYKKALVDRESAYQTLLEKERQHILGLLQEQRSTLEREYPVVEEVTRIAVNHSKRLWWRRPMDSDFLSLRLGTGRGVASFKINPPRFQDQNDPLNTLGVGMIKEFQSIQSIPLLMNLPKIGSVAIASKNSSVAYEFARRLVLDVLVHHSPQDVIVSLLANTRDSENRWEWLKWVPHTAALQNSEKPRRLNFSEAQIDEYLKWLVDEFNSRSKQAANVVFSSNHKPNRSSLVVILDDTGIARQMPEICQIADRGHEVGIYLIFVGGQNWPRECRSRVELTGATDFQFVETWDVGSKGNRLEGKLELASIELSEKIARSLAGLEVIGGVANILLPESIRLSAVLGTSSLEVDSILKSWSADFQPDDLLHFPIGVCAGRDQLDLAYVNLLPESRGGVDAYHTILIGTTGSGKSEFMKSVVMGAALRYPPNLLNFFFLDFKGGAAFSVFENLPHVSGVVTNLKPELVERGLDSIRSEIDRRQTKFSLAQVQNIWGFNQGQPENPLPHLVLLLDEFARGLSDFPKLRETLDLLVRQGRSLGMYLILANQDSNSEVERLLNNVGWRIALKVGKDEEISMIDRSYVNDANKIPRRAGEGYLRSIKGVITRFQAGYAGLPVLKNQNQNNDEFMIYSVESNGALSTFYKNKISTSSIEDDIKGPVVTEEEMIISNIKQVTRELSIKPVPRIYLEPLSEIIDLGEIISDSVVKTKFTEGEWTSDTVTRSMIAPIGFIDSPSECLQEILEIDFSRQDGHLWIAGAPGSGKAMTLMSLILSLSLTHTPDELQFYILEFGSGSLRQLETLPHVGSVIRLQEKEKIQRLIDFLDSELNKRSSHDTLSGDRFSIYPDLFIVVNNYAEFRASYPDEADHISRYIRDGKAAGIHLIITTNRGAELSRNIASNIARKIVLQLASRDEYTDIVGRMISPPSVRSEGRGFWVDERPYECQIGCPNSFNIKKITKEMDAAWMGSRPKIIGTIPTCISLHDLSSSVSAKKGISFTRIPVGISYENLEVVLPDLTKEMAQWLILGPRESGKSNFLACTARHLLEKENNWDVSAFSLKRTPLSSIRDTNKGFQFAGTAEKAAELIKTLVTKLEQEPEKIDKHYILLIDDLGAVFEPGLDTLNSAINSLLPFVSSRADVHMMAAGFIDELRSQMASPIIKALRQSRTGIVFSKDTGELDWLGTQIPLEYRKLDIPAGRGFFVSKGKQMLVQTPFLGECKGKHADD